MHTLTRYLLAGLLVLGAPIPVGAAPAAADGVVGDGTPASCTDAELTLELSVSGPVTFACGAAPYTLTVTTAGGIAPAAGTHSLDGGGLISLSGGNVIDRRIFNISASTSLTLTDLTLLNTRATADDGGALYNQGRLVLDGVTIHHSTAVSGQVGGAIYNSGPSLVVRDSLFYANSAFNGGAIYNQTGAHATLINTRFLTNSVTADAYGGALTNVGIMTITAGLFANNAVTLTGACAVCGGGAVANYGGALLTISGTVFSANRSQSLGGAMWNQGHVWLQNAAVTGNTTELQGGGLANTGGGQLAITHTLVSGNRAIQGAGGGIHNNVAAVRLLDVTISDNAGYSGGGLYNATGYATLTNVTLSGNRATTSVGGGILSYQSTLTLTNVTLNANTTPLSGAALRTDSGSTYLRYVTVSDNRADVDANGTGNEGAIENIVSVASHLYVTAVLLANNTPHNCQGKAPDNITFSLTTDDTCLLDSATPQALTPLANNGGYTLTRLPVPGSAALEAGICLFGQQYLLDQRGQPRPFDTFCDIGAVERQADDYGWYIFLPASLRE